MLFLRLTPLVPNWFVNLGSPIVGISIRHFALGTLFGLMPLNIIHIHTGLNLANLTTFGPNYKVSSSLDHLRISPFCLFWPS